MGRGDDDAIGTARGFKIGAIKLESSLGILQKVRKKETCIQKWKTFLGDSVLLLLAAFNRLDRQTFLDMTPKQNKRKKKQKKNFKLLALKDTLKKVKIQPTEWDKIFANTLLSV